MKCNRLTYAAATGAMIVLGLLSRKYPNLLPAGLGKYPGDALWAMMVFCGLSVLQPRRPTVVAGLIAFTFSCAVESFQLYQAPWIDSIRDTLPGRLILGRGFSWIDLGAYAIGVLTVCLVESGICKYRARKNSSFRVPPQN